MFAVLFEVHPDTDQWDSYLGFASLLKPELENIDGFVDNIRYRSLTREGWLLSLSDWRDEKALVRWRTRALHHDVQQKGRDRVFADYHLRVGQITDDTHVPAHHHLEEQRFDVTDVGQATAVTISNPVAQYRDAPIEEAEAATVAADLGLDTSAAGLTSWDVFDAVRKPGNPILLRSWRDSADVARAAAHRDAVRLRHRTVRIIRDYGMFDRREAPQFYDPVER